MRRRGNAAPSNCPVAFPSRSPAGSFLSVPGNGADYNKIFHNAPLWLQQDAPRKLERRFRTIADPKLAARRIRSAGLLQRRKTRISFESISAEGYE